VSAKTIWKVNGCPIPSAELRRETAALRQEAEAQGAELSMEERLSLSDEALERLIERTMLRTSAHRLGFTPTQAEVEETLARLAPRNDGVAGCRAGMASEENLEDIRHRLAVDKMMQATLNKVKHPQAWQLQEFYGKNQHHFRTPELAHVWHLVSTDLAVTEHMLARVENGEDFALIAQEESDCKEHGGDLGYFARGTMVDEFDEVIFATAIGQLTPIFQTRFGYHAAIVKDRRAAGIRTLDEVEPEIASIVLRQAQDAACGELFEKLRKNTKVEQVIE
jgi:parvulin-like peptidyl-prolyl isomerase